MIELDKEARRLCPLNDLRPCRQNCAWNVAGGCAMSVLAQQAERGSNELYAMVDLMGGTEAEQIGEGADDSRE